MSERGWGEQKHGPAGWVVAGGPACDLEGRQIRAGWPLEAELLQNRRPLPKGRRFVLRQSPRSMPVSPVGHVKNVVRSLQRQAV